MKSSGDNFTLFLIAGFIVTIAFILFLIFLPQESGKNKFIISQCAGACYGVGFSISYKENGLTCRCLEVENGK
jgi:hypothetical protein